MTLPSYNFLPAPLWLITVLHIVTLTLHFLAMNFLLGGLAVVTFARLKNKWNDPAVQSYVKLLPSATAATAPRWKGGNESSLHFLCTKQA